MKNPRNSLALLAFAALCVIAAVVLLLSHDPVPSWMSELPKLALLGSAAVMTPGLSTAKQLLQGGAATSSPAAADDVPPLELAPGDVEP